MCGISGFMLKEGTEYSILNNQLQKMNNSLIHRGPNNEGQWIDNEYCIGLAHRRLSILDLSSAGNQPMHSLSNRFVIVYNGEIYNHLDLRKEISNNYNFKGTSDTETLLACIESFGIENTLKKIEGMFAFALWDKKNKELILAKDKFGEKPIYYGWQDGNFVFASELKGIKELFFFENKLNKTAISEYIKYSYIPSPISIYKNIYKLSSASFLVINYQKFYDYADYDIQNNIVNHDCKIKKYWDIKKISQIENTNLISDEKTAIDELDFLLSKSIKMRSISDVSLGVLLSGGIDSSSVASVMQSQLTFPIETFTLGFKEEKYSSYNEAHKAKNISKYIKSNHNEYIITHKEALDVVPKLSYIYDEPFADSSQIPTYLISNLASQKVTVALSGDGGDEFFGGYNRYTYSKRIWKKINFLPFRLRNILAAIFQRIPYFLWHYFDKILFYLNNDVRNLSDKIDKLSQKLIDVKNLEDLYISLITVCPDSYGVMRDYSKTSINYTENYTNDFKSNEEKMMYWDVNTYLPDDILCKVDRASMINSLEVRSPILDSEIYKFSCRLPLDYKIRGNKGKYILRKVLSKYIPEEIVDGPKMGFGIPLGDWLRGPLKDISNNYFDYNKIKNNEFLSADVISNMWKDHYYKKKNYDSQLWNILILQMWLENNKSS